MFPDPSVSDEVYQRKKGKIYYFSDLGMDHTSHT